MPGSADAAGAVVVDAVEIRSPAGDLLAWDAWCTRCHRYVAAFRFEHEVARAAARSHRCE